LPKIIVIFANLPIRKLYKKEPQKQDIGVSNFGWQYMWLII